MSRESNATLRSMPPFTYSSPLPAVALSLDALGISANGGFRAMVGISPAEILELVRAVENSPVL